MMLPRPADVRCRPCARKPCNAACPSRHKAVLLSLCRPCWALDRHAWMSMMMPRRPSNACCRHCARKPRMQGPPIRVCAKINIRAVGNQPELLGDPSNAVLWRTFCMHQRSLEGALLSLAQLTPAWKTHRLPEWQCGVLYVNNDVLQPCRYLLQTAWARKPCKPECLVGQPFIHQTTVVRALQKKFAHARVPCQPAWILRTRIASTTCAAESVCLSMNVSYFLGCSLASSQQGCKVSHKTNVTQWQQTCAC